MLGRRYSFRCGFMARFNATPQGNITLGRIAVASHGGTLHIIHPMHHFSRFHRNEFWERWGLKECSCDIESRTTARCDPTGWILWAVANGERGDIIGLVKGHHEQCYVGPRRSTVGRCPVRGCESITQNEWTIKVQSLSEPLQLVKVWLRTLD